MNTNLTFATQEQAELFQLIQDGKVFDRSRAFAESIATTKSPTSTQLFYVNKIIQETKNYHSANTVDPNAPAPKFDFSKVVKLFNNAKQHLKRPRITLLLDANDEKSKQIRFTFDAHRSMLWIREASYYAPKLGAIYLVSNRVSLNLSGRAIEVQFNKLLEEFTADPEAIAIMHGKLTGHCCFCALPLSDPRSLHAGFGEICAKHYHLPWGARPPIRPMTNWIEGDAQ